jgi:4-amino-4-deoxy-L-arabinose transferase-like glycosyltransferase
MTPRRIEILALLVLVLLAWILFRPVAGCEVGTDSGIFAAVGSHLLAGKVLYRDVWDHKPPVVYLVNEAALRLGGRSILSVRVVEQLLAMACALLCYGILKRGLKHRAVAFGGTLIFLFMFHRADLLENGNLTEEYATPMVLGGILAVLFARSADGRRAVIPSGIAGALFSLAAWTKEPFVLSSVVWFVYLLWREDKRRRLTCRCAASFVAGALVPASLLVLYLARSGAVGDWLDVLSFSFGHVEEGQSSFVNRVGRAVWRIFHSSVLLSGLTILGVFAAAVPPVLRRYSYLPAIAVAALVFDFSAVIISDKLFGHYYLQLIPSLVIVISCGLAGLRSVLPQSRAWGVAMLAACVFVMYRWDHVTLETYLARLTAPVGKYRIAEISQYVVDNARPGDTLWTTSGHYSRHYVETGLLSPTRYLAPFEHHFIDSRRVSASEKWNELLGALGQRPPRFLVDDREGHALSHAPLNDWIDANYERTEVTDERARLHMLRESR